MPTRVAINGFGRIGRLTFRNLFGRKGIEVVAINDLTDNATLAHLLKYDSAHGKYDHRISSNSKNITVDGVKIAASSERDPAKLPWKEMKIDVVLECTGIFRTSDAAGKHIKAGAKKVVLSAPAKSDDITTVVLGVNSKDAAKKKKIFSNASCTTNCLAPVMKVLDKNFGFVQGLSLIHISSPRDATLSRMPSSA